MISRKYKIIGLCVLIVSLVFGCKRKDEVTLNQAAWSSKDPVAIPFAHRKNHKSSGNLVFNPSFETGKIYYEKSNIKSFDVTGWKKTGENVHWVDTETNRFKPTEVYDGTHAIKIIRTHSDETESLGVGIVSDYIKVFPGNYSLSMYLKLENVCPNRARLGTKLYDAVHIRLQYFDKNKIEISSDEYDPYRSTTIDNGFKSLNLANYWNISEFGWGKVIGQAAKFPFLDGDILDEARYVKIFIGLKGTGTLWIDKVDFSYTRHNFTFLERMRPYFDSSYTAYDLIVPQPRKVKKLPPYSFSSPHEVLPVIVIPQNPQPQTLFAAQKIKETFVNMFTPARKGFSAKEIKIESAVNTKSRVDSNTFIISLGKTHLFDTYQHLFPDSLTQFKEQGYFITQLNEKSPIVFLYGSDPEGNFNAALTFTQLMNQKDQVYYSAEIYDYPDFKQRAFLLHDYRGTYDQLKKNIQCLSDYKLNHAYFEIYEQNGKHYPFKQIDPEVFIGKTSVMIDLLKFSYNGNFDTIPASGVKIIPQKTNYIARQISSITAPGLKNILIKGDYLQPYDTSNPEWIKFNTNEDISVNLQKYHQDLLNQLTNSLSETIEFMPPWSRLDYINMGMGQAEFYFRDLIPNISPEISIYWTGGSYCSPSVDFAEWYRMKKLIKANPVLLDNSLNYTLLRFKDQEASAYYAGKLRILSLFEPLEANYPDQFNLLSNQEKIILNIDSLTTTNRLKALTAAAYYWNTADYDTDKTIWKLLVKYYGSENAQNLVYFNDAYFGLLEICQKMKNNGVNNKNSRIAGKFLDDLNHYTQLLKNNIKDKELMEELTQLKGGVVKEHEEIISSQNY
ncbi:MAG: beta-N-acetylglucosaminidase domain-containing protein [Bacteroidales bacterium]|jgi:hypothetical protein|nr:beta-N-acetylglucosaminidase domain-containing protein [Bacteroidales bacterium]